MSPNLASLLFAVFITGLFVLDRDNKLRTSKALWIPVLWLLINGSRPVSLWLQGAAPIAQTSDQYLEGSPIDRNIYTALEALGLFVLVARREKIGVILKSNLPIIIFFAYCAVSALWSDYPDVSLKRWFKGFGDLEMGLIVVTDPDPLGAFKRLLTRVGFVLMPISVLFIKYYPALGRVYNRWTWTPTYVGVTGNKNELGMICLVVGLGSVWRLMLDMRTGKAAGRPRHLMAHGILLVVTLWLFSMASSTTSLSCLLMGTGVLAVMSSRTFGGKTALVHMMVAAMILVAVFALFLDPGGALLESMGKDPTLTGRTDIWKGLIGMVVNPVVGAGYESFWLGSRLVDSRSLMWRLNEAHNGYLEVYLNLGAVGVVLLALVIVAGYRHVIAAYRTDRELGRLRVVYFGVAVVYSLTEAGFRLTSPTWIIFLLVTIAAPLRDALSAVSAPAPAPRRAALSAYQAARVLTGGSGRKID